jgi:hypothetical protein
VVWQGSAGDRRPYADHCRISGSFRINPDLRIVTDAALPFLVGLPGRFGGERQDGAGAPFLREFLFGLP